jgi:hypothetical protein
LCCQAALQCKNQEGLLVGLQQEAAIPRRQGMPYTCKPLSRPMRQRLRPTVPYTPEGWLRPEARGPALISAFTAITLQSMRGAKAKHEHPINRRSAACLSTRTVSHPHPTTSANNAAGSLQRHSLAQKKQVTHSCYALHEPHGRRVKHINGPGGTRIHPWQNGIHHDKKQLQPFT